MQTWKTLRRLAAQRDEKQIAALRELLARPNHKLVLEHERRAHRFAIEPGGVLVADKDVETLFRRRFLQVHDPGLFSRSSAELDLSNERKRQ